METKLSLYMERQSISVFVVVIPIPVFHTLHPDTLHAIVFTTRPLYTMLSIRLVENMVVNSSALFPVGAMQAFTMQHLVS